MAGWASILMFCSGFGVFFFAQRSNALPTSATTQSLQNMSQPGWAPSTTKRQSIAMTVAVAVEATYLKTLPDASGHNKLLHHTVRYGMSASRVETTTGEGLTILDEYMKFLGLECYSP